LSATATATASTPTNESYLQDVVFTQICMDKPTFVIHTSHQFDTLEITFFEFIQRKLAIF